jgi:hypothetical protein
MTNSRQKGARGEREVAALFNTVRHGFHQSQKTSQSSDVDHPRLWIEVKRREEPFNPDWMAQACADCPHHKVPIVIYRRSRTKWRVRLYLQALIDLIGYQPTSDIHTCLVDLSAEDFIELTNTRLP